MIKNPEVYRYNRQTGRMEWVCRLHPTSGSMVERMHPLTGGVLTLPKGEAMVQPGQFVRFYLQKKEIWMRVAQSQMCFGEGEGQTLHLQHALCTLGDTLLFGYRTLGGNKQVNMAWDGRSVKDVFALLLSCQQEKMWVMDETGTASVLNERYLALETENESILDALSRLCDEYPAGLMMTCDQRTFPWRLALHGLPTYVGTQLRLKRNLYSANCTISDSALATRLYPIGALSGGGHVNIAPVNGGKAYLTAESVEKWGIRSRIWSCPQANTPERLKVLAEKELKRICEPTRSIEVNAVDLYATTGQALDSFTPGTMCRVALPEDGITLTERILSVEHKDFINRPDEVRLVLASYNSTGMGAVLNRLTKSVEKRETRSTETARLSLYPFHATLKKGESAPLHFYLRRQDGDVSSCRMTWLKSEGAANPGFTVDGVALNVPQGEETCDIISCLKRDETGKVMTDAWHTVSVTAPADGEINVEISVESTCGRSGGTAA